MALALLLAVLSPQLAAAQTPPPGSAQNAANTQPALKNPASLAVSGPVSPGDTVMVAIVFAPTEGWHGYWRNPGDAGLGMQLDWTLPDGWSAGEPRYPVPETLFAFGFMNHVYERRYAVLVPVKVASNAARRPTLIELRADYLTCSDSLCVKETAQLAATVMVGMDGPRDPRFAAWNAAIPPLIDAPATVERKGETIAIAIPLPRAQRLDDPHLFITQDGLVDYGAPQTFLRGDDRLVVKLEAAGGDVPQEVSGLLRFGDGDRGIAFRASPGPVDAGGMEALGSAGTPPLWALLLGALAGGALLNILPCVFPILSLKALHLAKASGSEAAARRDALAYSAGVIVAVAGLGATLLALRAGGEQIGWAFQLQQPGVVIFLLALVAAITANLAGLYELPALGTERDAGGSFGTGVLAAFIATPCTGPFMAAGLGAALVLPATTALGLFAALGLGLALPFLLIGFVPALRRRLPTPGPWMATFRRWMAVPMGLTGLALAWLAWRLGGLGLMVSGLVLAALIVAVLIGIGRRQRGGKPVAGGMVAAIIAAVLAIVVTLAVATPRFDDRAATSSSLLQPVPYDEAALREAKASGRPVFLWFTADWCLTCKVNEQVAIEREATRDALVAAGVVAMRGDWTRSDPAITRYLESKGAAGVPLYVWVNADGEETVLPQVLPPNSIVDLAKAGEPTGNR